jgi:hypothetical protein
LERKQRRFIFHSGVPYTDECQSDTPQGGISALAIEATF